jgi:hypothetical protein
VTASLIYGFWYAAIAFRGAAAFRLWRNRMVERFPTVWAYLVISALRDLILVYWFRHRPHTYAVLYSQTVALEVLVQAFAVVGVFFTVAEHYPKFRIPGAVLLSALALMGTGATLLTHSFAVPAQQGWGTLWPAAILSERYAWTVMVVMLAGSRLLLPKVRGIPIRSSARRASDILTLQCLGSLTCAVLAGAGIITLWNYVLPLVFGVTSGTLWLFWLTPASDRCEEPAPFSDEQLAFLARPNRSYARLVRLIESRKQLR